MFNGLVRWYRVAITPIFARQNELVQDMVYWRSRTLVKERVMAIIGLVCLSASGVGVAIVIVINTQRMPWLAYMCVAIVSLFCLWGISALVLRLWLITKVLKRKKAAKKIRH